MALYKNYEELKRSVLDWMDRDDLEPHLPEFIRNVTVEATRDLRVAAMEVSMCVPILTNGKVEIPADLIEAINVSYLDMGGECEINNRIPLHRSSKFQFDESRMKGEESDVPTSFCSQGQYFGIFPLKGVKETFAFGQVNIPNEDENLGFVEIHYYQLPATMQLDTDQNWLLCVAPDIYFYGTMMHACRFTRDFETAEYWTTKFKTAIADLEASSKKADQAGGAWMIGG